MDDATEIPRFEQVDNDELQDSYSPDEATAAEAPHAAGDHTAGAREKIRGIFSTQSVEKVGTGTTIRRTIQKTFWMAEERDDGSIQIQPLNVNCVPSGPKRTITKEDLLRQFSPEPEFYVHSVFPAMQKLQKTIELGEDHRKKGKTFSAEFELTNALKVDVDNVRANFGLGLTYLERGEAKKANNIFERLVKLDAAFEPEHKHLFNDFGINLRKNKMFDQAVNYYERALQLSKADEHLHYNIARVYFAKGELDKTVEHLRTALGLNAEFEAGLRFMDWLKLKGYVDLDGKVSANPPPVDTDAKTADLSDEAEFVA